MVSTVRVSVIFRVMFWVKISVMVLVVPTVCTDQHVSRNLLCINDNKDDDSATY